MGSNKTLDQCRKGSDFIAYGKRHGGTVTGQRGSHVHVEGPNGDLVIIPNHPGDLATGTRFSIKKAMIAAGMIGLLIWLGPLVAQMLW